MNTPNRENVIRGLECCGDIHTAGLWAVGCIACPYGETEPDGENGKACVRKLFADAIELLGEQEPRVLTLEEVRALRDDAVVWLEDNDKTDVIPAIVNHVWKGLPNIVSFSLKNMREVKANMLWHGFKWRCWTSRPDEATREATPW